MAFYFLHTLFISLSFYLLTHYSSFSYAANTFPYLSSNVTSGKNQAERIIKSFNLSPAKSINVVSKEKAESLLSSFTGSKIVEKPLIFPSVVGSGASVEELGHHAGYYNLPHSKTGRLFYFFFESRVNTSEPVVLWLTGGPGCSGELAMFYENGPFKLAKNNSLEWNEYGWDKVSNIIYIDQPIGTGFSYTTDWNERRTTEEEISNDLFGFLQEFLKKHPQFVANDFYITGESYAGHYIPAFATRILKGNKAKEGLQINLKGFAIGNGETNPAIQYTSYVDYSLHMKLIGQQDYESTQLIFQECLQNAKKCGPEGGFPCRDAYAYCTHAFNTMLNMFGTINFYDIRKQCKGRLCYDFSPLEKFLNEKSVREALGVGDIDFVSCSRDVQKALIYDFMRNLDVGIPAMLEAGVKVLIYAGEYDLICNWEGNSNWVHAMEWSGRKQFGDTKMAPFLVDGSEAGLLKNYGPLSFLKVHNAGHLVPMDQPKAALQMLSSWMHGKLTVADSE